MTPLLAAPPNHRGIAAIFGATALLCLVGLWWSQDGAWMVGVLAFAGGAGIVWWERP